MGIGRRSIAAVGLVAAFSMSAAAQNSDGQSV
jgi:hypothetical protein